MSVSPHLQNSVPWLTCRRSWCPSPRRHGCLWRSCRRKQSKSWRNWPWPHEPAAIVPGASSWPLKRKKYGGCFTSTFQVSCRISLVTTLTWNHSEKGLLGDVAPAQLCGHSAKPTKPPQRVKDWACSMIINVNYRCGWIMRRNRQRVSGLRKPGRRVLVPKDPLEVHVWGGGCYSVRWKSFCFLVS